MKTVARLFVHPLDGACLLSMSPSPVMRFGRNSFLLRPVPFGTAGRKRPRPSGFFFLCWRFCPARVIRVNDFPWPELVYIDRQSSRAVSRAAADSGPPFVDASRPTSAFSLDDFPRRPKVERPAVVAGCRRDGIVLDGDSGTPQRKWKCFSLSHPPAVS